MFKIVKAVVEPLSYFLRVTLIDVPPVLHNVPAITKDFELAVTISVKLLLDIATVASSKLFAETLLQRKGLDPIQITSSLEKIIQEQNRLNELVEKILLVSTIDEMHNDMHLKPISIHLLIDQIIENTSNSHKLINSVPKDLIVNGDDFYFISLFQNLLDNAQKYSPDGSEINFYLKENPIKNIICISDQGIGISDKEKSKIFDRFYRIEDEETRNSKGTGLGLFLVNQIIKIHGGKIYCKDNSPNGAIFEIHLKK